MSAGKVTKAESQSLAKSKSTFREYAEAIGMALLLALFIRTFIVQAFKIPSGSMIPTLQIGDHILVNKLAYGIRVPFLEDYVIDFSKPKRGDVIVFIFPEDRSKDFIKRVLGVAGDVVQIRGKKVSINGKEIDDPHAHFEVMIRKPPASRTAMTTVLEPCPRITFLSWAITAIGVTIVVFGVTSTWTRCAAKRF
jgi:signal peptidase I